MIDAELIGDKELLLRFNSFSPRLLAEATIGMTRITVKMQRTVVTEKLSGQVLGVRTGRLRRSIDRAVLTSGSQITGTVSTKLGYGIGWETGWQDTFGASIAKAKAKFKPGGGGDTFLNGTPKKRPFLVPTLAEAEQSGMIVAEMNDAVTRAKNG